MPALRSRTWLAVATALVATGAVLLVQAATSIPEPVGRAEATSGAPAPEPESWTSSLGVAGGILVVAGIGVGLLAFTDFGKPSRR